LEFVGNNSKLFLGRFGGDLEEISAGVPQQIILFSIPKPWATKKGPKSF
jgi:hypothetical protein